jgi:hypothetical protein
LKLSSKEDIMPEEGNTVPDDLRNAIIQETLRKKQTQVSRSGVDESVSGNRQSIPDASVADIGLKLHQIDLAKVLENRYASEDESKDIERQKLITESDMGLIGRLLNG